ncbi:transcriptional regulator [Escherichia coli]|nr:transcriptional regulator [Escherichia coli]
MSNSKLYMDKKYWCTLSPGKISERQFWLLVEISPIHSEKVINALQDFLVMGYNRREACERHAVSQGYFSGALRRFQHIHQTVNKLVPFYISEASVFYTG